MTIRSKVTIAKRDTSSLRSTIPISIVEYLEINKGDYLEWKMELSGSGKVVVIKKSKGK